MNDKTDYSKIKEILSSIQELMNCLVNDLSRIEIDNEYKSSITAETLLELIWRNVKAILCLVSCDICFLPSALIISRTLLEEYSKLIWLIQPDNIIEREINLFYFLQYEKNQITTYINNLKEVDSEYDISSFESDKKDIEEIQDYIRKKLNEESQNQSSCNYSNFLDDKPEKQIKVQHEFREFKALLEKIDEKSIYPAYCRFSQSVHANHASLWKFYNDTESIVEKDWYDPLFICLYTLIHGTLTYLEKYSDNFDESLISEKSDKVKKALDNLISP